MVADFTVDTISRPCRYGKHFSISDTVLGIRTALVLEGTARLNFDFRPLGKQHPVNGYSKCENRPQPTVRINQQIKI